MAGEKGAGLRFITASVSQMLSGSCILFTAGLSVVVLRAKLNMLHYVGARPLSSAFCTAADFAVAMPVVPASTHFVAMCAHLPFVGSSMCLTVTNTRIMWLHVSCKLGSASTRMPAAAYRMTW